MTWLLAAFLVAHGAIHLAIWLPPQSAEPDADPHPPFAPDHSALLTRAHVSRTTTHDVAAWLAVAATVAYVVAGFAVGFGSGWAVALAAVAATVGLSLKVLFFNPWLSLGILIDAAVLSAALLEWPVNLT
jgi:hypothetical protein